VGSLPDRLCNQAPSSYLSFTFSPLILEMILLLKK
jgi:hypothetical protein